MEQTTNYNFDKIGHHDLVSKAIIAATKGHNNTNHLYGDASYTIHLALVVDVAYRFIHLIPIEMRATVIASMWLHDSIEDARMTYNDVVEVTNVDVAEIVYAVTNNKGRTRKDRANDNYYKGIREINCAPFVKLCDRIANIEFGGKGSMYRKEHLNFKQQLAFYPEYNEMWEFTDWLLEQIPVSTLHNKKNGFIIN